MKDRMEGRAASALRNNAGLAAQQGKLSEALALYVELARLEPTCPTWPKRIAELHRRRGEDRNAIAAFEEAADRYLQGQFRVHAMAMCRLILLIDPSHVTVKARLTELFALSAQSAIERKASTEPPPPDQTPRVRFAPSRAPAQPAVPRAARTHTPAMREPARLAELETLGLVDDLPPPAVLQDLLEAIAKQFGVSTALISLVTRDRQFFKAHYGLSGELLEQRGTPREDSFCRHVVEADHHTPLIVPNAFESPVFARHPLVTGGHVGSYVGVPLVSPRGNVLGTLCLIDSGPWLGSAQLVDALVCHARTVSGLLMAPMT